VDDVSRHPEYISAVAGVRSELAVPLIVKNRVIGVLNLRRRKLAGSRGAQASVDADRLSHAVASRMPGCTRAALVRPALWCC